MSPKPQVFIICGPTASGKTAKALKLAESKPTSIISADSRQIYKDLSVVTGKDLPKNFKKVLENIPYFTDGKTKIFGLDFLEANDNFSASDFVKLAKTIINNEISQGRRVIIVGGTGFYLKALTQSGLLANVPPNLSLREGIGRLTLSKLQQKLKGLNPDRWHQMNNSDQNNPRRLIRAIEIALTPEVNHAKKESEWVFKWSGIRVQNEIIKEKINQRVIQRINQGAIDEVKSLLAKFPNQSLPIYNTLGVKPILDFLKGEIDKNKLINLWVSEEYQYAKRQLTWFKKQSHIIWYDEIELISLD